MAQRPQWLTCASCCHKSLRHFLGRALRSGLARDAAVAPLWGQKLCWRCAPTCHWSTKPMSNHPCMLEGVPLQHSGVRRTRAGAKGLLRQMGGVSPKHPLASLLQAWPRERAQPEDTAPPHWLPTGSGVLAELGCKCLGRQAARASSCLWLLTTVSETSCHWNHV